MPKKGDIYLGPVNEEIILSPLGRKYKVDSEKIGRIERTASGRLVQDIRATKKKFTLTYEMIDGDDLDALIDLYDLETELSLLIYIADTLTTAESAGCEAYLVIMEPISYERLLLDGSGLFTGVTIVLNEV
jgi:hypothetical protein